MAETIIVGVADLIFRAKVSETARQVGRASIAATSPDAIVERAASHGAALVVIDLGDERLDPFETIRRLKASPETREARVVGFFSHVHTELRDRAREAGCDVVLPRSAFVARLARVLESLGADAA
jgi:CheY-like chemotaxis protein